MAKKVWGNQGAKSEDINAPASLGKESHPATLREARRLLLQVSHRQGAALRIREGNSGRDPQRDPEIPVEKAGQAASWPVNMWLYLAALLGLYYLRRWYRERQTVDKLTEKYVFITGCDSGFGKALARQLDTLGMHVLATCLTQEGAEELERLSTNRLKTILLDITSTEKVATATEWVKRCVGDKGEPRGRVVNVTSVAGRMSYHGGGYSPSKFALEAFSDSLRRELRPFGVRVSIIEPGSFLTGVSSISSFLAIWKAVPAEIKELYGQEYWNNFHKTFVGGGWRKTNLSLVTDCMEHALTSRYPRSRYSAGWDAKLFFIPLSYMPAAVGDFVMTYRWPKPAKAID
ncbi:hypothetical protein JRQ81_003958 [Phrynocephalus forsythii]|uniref:Retinol dehydrogenase 16-like n=1 Tax=Phrynocephalus forsythii TaxID=171643 RepID=A0A9Q0XLI8_9SAUR|nr:hypothetical protein JRQ81_003958 [Phrynocephalus forsythii]